MSRSLQLGLRTGDLFQTPSVPRSCSGIISKIITVQNHSQNISNLSVDHLKLTYRYKGRISPAHGKYFIVITLEIRKVQITKLHLNKTSRDEQHFSLAFQASSRRVLVSTSISEQFRTVFPLTLYL